MIDTGVVRLPTERRPAWRLLLVANSVHEGRPAGADPWDVRDRLDWLEPRLILDQAKLKIEVDRRRRVTGGNRINSKSEYRNPK